MGYHANIYYADFKPPPPKAHFSPEWGLDCSIGMGTVGDWVEMSPEQVQNHMMELANNPDVESLKDRLSLHWD